MARHGYEGPTRIFEGREGLVDSLGEEWKPEVLTDGLGQTFRITDCSIKPYPSEALTHAPISAALDLVLEHDLQPADIAEINIWTLRRAAEILADPAKYVINSRETADHSLPYCIGAAVVDRELTPHQFKRAKLSDPLILSTLKKVKAQLEPSFELRFPAEQPCRVEIKTMDGRSLTRERAYPKGDPRDPLSLEEVRGKFRALAAGVISDEQVEECFCLLDDLENLPDIGELMRGLATEPRRAAV
jgi:2-methylcitrate dehydratase